ncbi:MAG: isochorismatase family cysteine hydrolase [Sterolibacterium sp.]
MPPSIDIKPHETALLVVDMQNGFCDPKGSMALAEINYHQQNQIIPTVKELVEVCHDVGIQVLWSLQQHYPNDVTRAKHRIPTHLQKLGVKVCTKGTWDAELVDQLKVVLKPEDDIFEKHRSSCFYDTTLATKLRVRGITTLIVCGVATNYCVESTIRDAYARDFDIIVIEDAVASMWDDLHRATLKNVELMYGVVMSLSSLKDTLATINK